MRIEGDDARLAVQLLAAELKDGDESWWAKACRGLLSRITGDKVVCGCNDHSHEVIHGCEGLGVLFNGSREVKHGRCDGKGYHTAYTLHRHCAYCPEDNPDELTLDGGVWICDCDDCAIDHAIRMGVAI